MTNKLYNFNYFPAAAILLAARQFIGNNYHDHSFVWFNESKFFRCLQPIITLFTESLKYSTSDFRSPIWQRQSRIDRSKNLTNLMPSFSSKSVMHMMQLSFSWLSDLWYCWMLVLLLIISLVAPWFFGSSSSSINSCWTLKWRMPIIFNLTISEVTKTRCKGRS